MQGRCFERYSTAKGLIFHSAQNLPEKGPEMFLFKNSSAEKQTADISLMFAEAKAGSRSLCSGVAEKETG